jgi:hypothetical protein
MKTLALVALLLCLPACGRDLARVAVRNNSNSPISALHLYGKCFDQEMGTLVPGGIAEVRVRPCGESGVQARFTANGSAHVTPAVGYIEASSQYDERFTLGPDYKLSLDR